jgi:hypothetical protein
MNVGSTGGVMGSAAGAPLAQTSGSETERTQKDAGVSQRQAVHEKKAADAAGIGTTEQDQEASERDADGRRFWEKSAERKPEDEPTAAPRLSKDPTGASGNSLDLTG